MKPTMRLNNRIRQEGRGYLAANGTVPSAVILPHMAKTSSAKAFLRRVDKRRAALAVDGKKPSDRSISLQATKSPDTLRNIRRQVAEGKQQGVSTETIQKFVEPLKTTLDWLASESGPETPVDDHIDSAHILPSESSERHGVRIVGYVGAGSEAHYYALADEDFQTVDPPAGASDQTVAVEIRGKSWGPLMDSWLVFYDDVRSPITPDLHGQVCVVGLADDRILIKQIRPNRDGTFTLLSNSNEPPIENAVVEWAAKVLDIRPRR